ncbi:MAG: hypothetical protein M1825_001698 [Sarcosagium campestre]|nr:MAG: hypothetical protein M1825_001698 [Sarcosagium campestre]
MPPVRPKLSITLPRNFTFHYTDGQAPRTPERDTEEQPRLPSPPRPYRLRTRRRPQLPPASSFEPSSSSPAEPHNVPLPTIEAPQPFVEAATLQWLPDHQPAKGLLAPLFPVERAISPPKTPSAQVFVAFDKPATEPRSVWGGECEVNPGESISRPTSACSVSSDSSNSSSGTSASIPSNGGSCTSPESDAPDPFWYPSTTRQKGKARIRPSSPTVGRGRKVSQKLKFSQWTDDMDTHLWKTYLLYLQDPTVTPIRVNPGSVPPLGVCHRVAREAKRSWRESRPAQGRDNDGRGFLTDPLGKQVLRDVNDEANAVNTADSPDTLTDKTSGSLTPTGKEGHRVHIKWPRSEGATRRRLRVLCKRKATPSTSLQRHLQSRSPTPFQRPRARLASPFGGLDGPTFSTRDMAFSLSTSTSTTMHQGGPLAQLSQGESSVRNLGDEWFGQPPSRPQSRIQAELQQRGLGIDGLGHGHTFPRLGSPFAGRPRPSTLQMTPLRPQPSPPQIQQDSNDDASPAPALSSPVLLKEPIPFSSLKRRAVHQLEDELSPGGTDIRGSIFQDLFGAPADSSHRRVRSRGFSLGDISQGSRLSSLVTPPTMYDRMDSSEFANAATFDASQPDGLTPPRPAEPHRLGSPFVAVAPTSNALQSSTTSAAKNTAAGVSYTFSIEQRLEQFRDI